MKNKFYFLMALSLAISLFAFSACKGKGSSDICEGVDCGIDLTYDEDGDGVVDACDNAASDPDDASYNDACDGEVDPVSGAVGDGHLDENCSSADTNSDGVFSAEEYAAVGSMCDNCTTLYNPDQTDLDADGIGDSCDAAICMTGDIDGDNVCDGDESGDGTIDDNCTEYNPEQIDTDVDGIGDECDDDLDGDGFNEDGSDNCPAVSNADQTDADADSLGDACDTDRDGDGITDVSYPDGTAIDGGTDACPETAKSYDSSLFLFTDNDGDGVYTSGIDTPISDSNKWNGCCYDTDSDSICDNDESGTNVTDPTNPSDIDGDGIPDDEDTDDDGDYLPDTSDLCPTHSDDWLIFNVKKYVTDSSSYNCNSDQQYVIFMINEISITIGCVSSTDSPINSTTTESVVIDEAVALNCTLGAASIFGAWVCAYDYVNNWSDVRSSLSHAYNYSSSITSCTEGLTTSGSGGSSRSGGSGGSSLTTTRTVCGTLQLNQDGDGYGDSCDSEPTVYNNHVLMTPVVMTNIPVFSH